MKSHKWMVVFLGFVLCLAFVLSAQTADKDKEEKSPGQPHASDLDGWEALEALNALDLHFEALRALENLDIHTEGLALWEELEHLGETIARRLEGLESLICLENLSHLDVWDVLDDFDFDFNFDFENLVPDRGELDLNFDFDWEFSTPHKHRTREKDTKIK